MYQAGAGSACIRQAVSVSRAVVAVSVGGRARLVGAERVELGTQLPQRAGCALLEARNAARCTQQTYLCGFSASVAMCEGALFRCLPSPRSNKTATAQCST